MLDKPGEDDVARLWADYHEHRDQDARNRLVVHYAPLVKYVAGRVGAGMPSFIDRSDLISEGVVGLMDAIEKFHPDRGAQFQTYAVTRIRGSIMDSLRLADWAPRSVRARERGQRPADGPVAPVLAQVSVGHLPDLEGLALTEQLRGADADGAVDEETRALLARTVRTLPERDAIVIALYYFEGLTLAEIGQVLSVSESRVSQLHSRATLALRAQLEAAAAE